MNVITERHLAAQVSGWKRKRSAKENPTIFGVRTDLEYAGSERITIEKEEYRVKVCRSDLEARELLIDFTPGNVRAVLLFKIQHDRIGPDLLARFAAQRLLSIDPTSTLLELFEAKTIDPRISNHRVLIEALVQKATQEENHTSRAGVLDADLAWSVILDMPEIADARPDLIKILRMSRNEGEWAPIASLSPEVAKHFFEWVGERSGIALDLIYTAVVLQRTPPELLLPIGLCLEPLYKSSVGEDAIIRAKALTKLEPYVGNREIDSDSARIWSEAAVASISVMKISELRNAAMQADDLLNAIKADSIAREVALSKTGIELLFDDLAEAIMGFYRRKDLNGFSDLKESLVRLKDHRLSSLPDYHNRVDQASMAVRLALWSRSSEQEADNLKLDKLMNKYFRSSCYADRALVQIADSDSRPEVERAYRTIRKRVTELRALEQIQFAKAAARWNLSPQEESILKVEDILSKIVSPLAKKSPVLLLVLDGMSCAVFSQLLEDLLARDWFTIAPRGMVQEILAAIPSVTAISRKALFSGKIDASDRRTESVAFRDNEALVSVSSKAKPRLFLKGELSDPGNSALSEELRECLENSNHTVVSVLLNVVDDQLSGSDQLKIDWEVDSIRHLAQILESANVGERTIILTSDHGNVIDLNQTRKIGERIVGGDRYREAGELFDPDHEVCIQGPRIERATGKNAVVVAATDQVRYAGKKAGYHGGCADMEVVIPLAVLQRNATVTPDGWDFVDIVPPQWWELETSEASEEPAKTISPRKTKSKKVKEPEEPLLFALPFENEPQPEESSWVGELLDCSIFEAQSKSLGRTPLKKEMIRSFLRIMDQRQGAAPMQILASEMGIPLMRLRGMIAHLRRLFNIDGYEIVSEEADSSRVLFDTSMALKQFAVKTR